MRFAAGYPNPINIIGKIAIQLCDLIVNAEIREPTSIIAGGNKRVNKEGEEGGLGACGGAGILTTSLGNWKGSLTAMVYRILPLKSFFVNAILLRYYSHSILVKLFKKGI